MAELVCEICGGKLIGKPGGIFECDSCGVQYSTEWAKAKIQNIRGTVKVEGTVNVTGEVQVTGSATKDSLLKRAKMCFDDGSAEKAKELLDQVLNADPECGEAYLYQCALNGSCKTIEQLHSLYMDINEPRVWESPEMQKAIQFAVDDCKTLLDNWVEERSQNVAADLVHRQEILSTLEARRKKFAPVQKLISLSESHVVAIRPDGTVMATGCNNHGQCNVESWTGIKEVVAKGERTYGLKYDGTVVACGLNLYHQCDVQKWKDIVEISANLGHVVGLKSDGTVVATGENREGTCDVSSWSNIVEISAGLNHTVGLKSDGTVVATGSNTSNECDVADWENIISISAGISITTGVCADGTVRVASSYGSTVLDEVRKWQNINKIVSIDGWSIVGIRDDGTICSTGLPRLKINTNAWRDIVVSFPEGYYIAGITVDGKVVATGENNYGQCNTSDWKNIIMITGNDNILVGLLDDGTVITAGFPGGKEFSAKTRKTEMYKFNFDGWKLFDKLDNVEQAQKSVREYSIKAYTQQRKMHEQRIAELKKEKQALTAELKTVKGLFSGMKRKDLEERINKIDTQIFDLE